MKASEEIRAMRWMFGYGDVRIARVIALAKRVEALERVAEAARKYIDTDATNRRFREEVLSNALDALETKP